VTKGREEPGGRPHAVSKFKRWRSVEKWQSLGLVVQMRHRGVEIYYVKKGRKGGKHHDLDGPQCQNPTLGVSLQDWGR